MNRDTDERDGADLDALFAADAARRPGPPALDARVLAAVRAERRPVARRRPAPRWLAAAAVLVMAAALVPLVRQAPEPPETSVAPAPADALSRDEVAADVGIGGESAPAAEPETAPAPPPARESAPPARSSATLLAPAQRDDSISSSKATGVRQRTDPVTMDAEASPERWIAGLRERLRKEGATEALREDYRRFRARHPDVAPDAGLERALGDRETGAEGMQGTDTGGEPGH